MRVSAPQHADIAGVVGAEDLVSLLVSEWCQRSSPPGYAVALRDSDIRGMSTPTHPAAPLLDQAQAAALLGVRPRCLESWRARGQGPAYVRLSARLVRYRVEDLDRWVAAHRVGAIDARR